jgi:hypothetical protein
VAGSSARRRPAATARVITAAVAIMVVVFRAFEDIEELTIRT